MNATANPVAGVYLSAYGGNGKLVIVAINANATAASVPVYIEGQSVNSLTPYQTSASAKMAELSAVSVSGNQFTYSLPAQSITTFVATASAPFN